MSADAAYVAISPVRDEASHISSTIASMVAQTIRPLYWIIVDDGSTDQTAAIAEVAARTSPWIKVIRRNNRGFRQPGTGVVAAFHEGYRLIAQTTWDYIVKLDGDLSFGPDYFEKCFHRFDRDPRLGIGGGTICQQTNDRLTIEAPNDPRFHVRGATKIYKRACWEAIGGLIEAPGWDTVDEYKANMLGWTTYTFPEIQLRHHRHAGGAEGTWKNWVKNGFANYVAGYHPLFMSVKCAKRIFSRPFGIGAVGLMVGFASGYIRRQPQIDDRDLIRYVRRQQLRKLCLRPSLWDRSA